MKSPQELVNKTTPFTRVIVPLVTILSWKRLIGIGVRYQVSQSGGGGGGGAYPAWRQVMKL